MAFSAAARKASQPYRTSVPQPFASNIVESSHEEALFAYGEFCLFTMMWRPADFEAGLVGHCQTCYAGPTARQAAVFNQPTKRECPDCYGTTFEGGYRAQIIRPAVMADRNAEVNEEAKGVVVTDTIALETTSDFTFHRGDYVFRFDNTRFQCEEKNEAIVRTGFAPPLSADSFSGVTTAHMEEKTSVAFRIPPTDASVLKALLDLRGSFTTSQISLADQVSPNGYI